MDTLPDFEIYKPGRFGETLAWIGDMTGDGWPEFAVSNPEGRGEIYIYTMGEVSGDGPRPSALHGGELRIVPNPSSGMTLIGFDADEGAAAEVRIFDLTGHLVRGLCSQQRGVGTSWFRWDGRSASGSALPTGTYIATARIRNRVITRRIVLRK
jgi:hypothetical protein